MIGPRTPLQAQAILQGTACLIFGAGIVWRNGHKKPGRPLIHCPVPRRSANPASTASGVLASVLCLTGFFAAPVAHAVGIAFEPFQIKNVDFSTVALVDRFRRQEGYDGFGATALFLPPLFVDRNGDGQLEYAVDDGENWTWIWRAIAFDAGSSAGFVMAQAQMTYNAASGCFEGTTTFCGFLGGLQFWLTNQCLDEGDYEIELLHNGASVGKVGFRPTRFVPRALTSGHRGNIEPVIPGIDPTNPDTDVFVVVEDDLFCFRRLQDVTVRFTNTIAPGGPQGHGHDHFGPAEPGTGNYACDSAFSCQVVDDGAFPMDTIVEGRTSSLGVFNASYAAREFGVSETITISMTREPTPKDPSTVVGVDERHTLDIRHPGLFRVDAAGISAIRNLGTGCPHDPGAEWMTGNSGRRLRGVTESYLDGTGRMLSLNDASLPFGGFFDNGNGGGRVSPCHVSHRVGVDIDLNRIDSGGKKIRCRKDEGPGCVADTETVNGTPVDLIDYVDDLFERKVGRRILEGNSIHYRFPD